jgi:hypothetical protein
MLETRSILEGPIKLAAVAFEGHAGTLHLPPPGQRVRAVVVIVPPLGRDRIWTYRSLFEWANMLARHGYTALRYDPRDEGDSLFLGPGEELVTKWLEGVEQASRFARQICADQPLILSGLRIGATFAWRQVESVKPAALVLWDPLPSGQHWVRELKLASVMVKGPHTRPDGLEVNGLHLPPESLALLERLVLPTGTDMGPSVLLSSPNAAKLLRPRLGPSVDQIAFTGYTDLFRDSHVNRIPWQLFSDTLDWLNARLPARRSLLGPALPPAILSAGKWYEKRVELGQGLIGVLSLPCDSAPRRGVVFGNTSANPRAGDGNFTTRACRTLAACNVAALRIDFSGYGESPARAPDDLHVYETSRTQELSEATRFLKALGVTSVAVAGVCTGGYHAFRALMESEEIDQALPINAWLNWIPGSPLDRAEHVNAIRSVYLKVPAQIRQHLRFRHKMRAFVMPKLGLVKRFWRRGGAIVTVRTELQSVLRRHKKLDLIMWSEDRAVEGIEDFGPRGRWLRTQPGASLSFLPGIDHAVIGRHSQARVISELLRLLELECVQQLPLV